MLCPKCGKEIPDDARFCIFCGTEVKAEQPEKPAEAPPEPPVPSEPPVAPPPPPPPPKKEVKDTTGRFVSLVKFIVLYCITFGIYGLVWQYKTTEFLNRDEEEPKMNPTHALLLYMFVPFYNVYWFYRSSQKLLNLTGKKDRHSEVPAAIAVLSVSQLNLLSAVILQDGINALSAENINYSYGGIIPDQDIDWKDHFIDIVAHAILLGFTFGIYHLYWIYKTTQILNRDKAEKYQDPTHTVLFCLFVPLYTTYWYFISAKKLNHIAAQKGAELASPVLYTALSLLGASLLGAVFMQERVNQVISVQIIGDPKQKLHKCKACHTIYPASEETCPNCHVVYQKPFYKKWWFIALLVIAAIIISGTWTNTMSSVFEHNKGGYRYSYEYDYPSDNDSYDYYERYFSEGNDHYGHTSAYSDDDYSGMLAISLPMNAD